MASTDHQDDLPYSSTTEPWRPWRREGGLLDGDKVLIALAPDMAQAILRYTRNWYGTSCDDCDGTPENLCDTCFMAKMRDALYKIGAEL